MVALSVSRWGREGISQAMRRSFIIEVLGGPRKDRPRVMGNAAGSILYVCPEAEASKPPQISELWSLAKI